MKKLISLTILFAVLTVLNSCSTTRKKSEVKGFKKFFHNTTAKFNGYFNAEELIKDNMLVLQDMHEDNYNDILDVYDYVNVDNPQAIIADMDKAIEKVSTVATIHEVSNYLDDCYVVIGKAQYLKHDYSAAEETFQYFEEEFDPLNPYGRVYKVNNKKKTGKAAKKELKQARKEKAKEREEADKEREEIRDEKKKEREERDKERKKKAKERKKNAKKGKRTPRTKKDETTKVEKTPEQIAAAEASKKALEEAKKLKELEEKKAAELAEAKEEAKYKNEGEGGVFKNKSAYTEGLYWLARTYIETERFSTADYVIKRLENTAGLSEKISKRLPAAKAHMYLKSKEYPMALVELETAIENEGKKKNKARYAFIRAQLFERMGDNSKANAEYERAKKFSPDYEMELNAKLNVLKLSYKNGKTPQAQTIKKLEKILKDKKNNEFQDQVYFALAQVRLDGGDTEGAIDDFKSALASTGSNNNVKREAYYRLAELLFEEGYYSEAKTNYDSALSMMSTGDDRYKSTERIAKNLTDVSKNIDIVELQDSLLRLSLMDQEALNEIAKKLLDEQGSMAQKEDLASTNKRNIITSSRQIGANKSSFFAYNPVVLNKGKIEFGRIWGDRVMEDNWRRSLRSDANTSSDDLTIDFEEEEIEYTDKEIQSVLASVPRNEIQKKSANAKIQNALFELGILFRERIRNYKKSAEVLERLVREYPGFDRRDEALFYLYLSYLDMNEVSKADAVLTKLKNEFPESKFTKLATDPSYAQSLKSGEESIESYYDRTFVFFEKGNYSEVVKRSTERAKLFPGNKEYAAKFSLINAMSYGNIEGKDRYVKELQNLIKVYPKTPEEARAKEILRFLKGDEDAFNDILFDEALDVFEADDKKLHYVFVVTYGLSQKDFDRAKLDVSAYNKEFNRFDNLKISNIYLNPDNQSQIILIRSFKNKDEALEYYKGVDKNKSEFIKNKEVGYDIFVTTQRNYREVIKQRTINNYRPFFEKNYLKKN